MFGSRAARLALAALTFGVGLAFPTTAGATHGCAPGAPRHYCAPPPPQNLVVEQGTDWRAQTRYTFHWNNPGGHSHPIPAARITMAHPASGYVSPEYRYVDSAGITSLSIDVPSSPGVWHVWIHLEDSSGNHWPNNDAGIDVRFDPTVPGQAEPARANGWIGIAEATSYPQPIRFPREDTRQAVGPSGIKGYMVELQRADRPPCTLLCAQTFVPGETVTHSLSDLPEGRNTLRARAVSGAGVASNAVAEVELPVDLSAPRPSIAGAPPAEQWQRTPVTVSLQGEDQAHLSGMAPAPDGEPVEGGTYLEARVGDGPPRRLRGGSASLEIAEDGEHAVSLRAVDFAGNPSPERQATVRVDRTAPETVVFEEQEPNDPRRIVVAASDRTSGLAAGQVELRRAGTSTWQALATRRDGGRFVAYVDDETLDGTASYELRARVRDVAGNEAIGDRRRSGARAVVNPGTLRGQTVLTTEFRGVDGRRANCKAQKGRKRRKRPAAGATARAKPRAKPRCRATGRAPSVELPLGKTATVTGQVVTRGGRPIAGAAVEVQARLARSGAQFAREGGTATDGGGRFSYTVPAGASRTLRFVYPGTNTLRPSASELGLVVPASSLLRVSRRRVRLGQRVTFSGRLATLGVELPPSGVLVELQARDRGRWRKFATARTDSRGGWSYRFRFERTRGRVTYPLRAVVHRQDAWPFGDGMSRRAKITVRGR